MKCLLVIGMMLSLSIYAESGDQTPADFGLAELFGKKSQCLAWDTNWCNKCGPFGSCTKLYCTPICVVPKDQPDQIDLMKEQIEQLKEQVAEIKDLIEQMKTALPGPDGYYK